LYLAAGPTVKGCLTFSAELKEPDRYAQPKMICARYAAMRGDV